MQHDEFAEQKKQNMTMKTITDPITAARHFLEGGDYHAAHLLLAAEFEADPLKAEFGRIANLILPCRMFDEALDTLRGMEIQRFIDPPGAVEEYRANRPHDEDIGKLVTA